MDPTTKDAEDADARLQELIYECLELYETRGPSAVDDVLEAHPEAAEAVRGRLQLLGRLGMLGDAGEEAPPRRIGTYIIHGVLGRGGMGVVYEAEQERPSRRVALKVLRSLPGPAARARFWQEAQLLARLQHPGIAQIYETGEATLGGVTVPFFAMELVRGVPVDRFVRERELGLRGCLELVARIADAVQHAHQQGVVHRDLKPANVLVDETGQPRVLDFGIARVTDPDMERDAARTRAGEMVGTLAYMSPEQAAGDSRLVDTRTDVYSLGVLGFQLLVGRLPRALDELPVLEALEALRDEEVPRLGSIERALRGDVETIFAKALAREKERRYSSTHELAADIRRYQANEPIAARPATASYQLAKFARRHRALVLAAGGILLALALGLAGTVHGLLRAEEQRLEAERRFQQASAVLAFQSRMFASADPKREGIGVVDLLDRAVLMIEGDVTDPVEEAAVRTMLGEAYAGLGEWEKAEPLVSRAVEVYREHVEPGDLQALAARRRQAELLGLLGRFDEAQRALDGVVETARNEHAAAHDAVRGAELVRARLSLETGAFDETVALAREVRAGLGPESAYWVEASRLLAEALEALDADESVAVAEDTYERLIAARGAKHPLTIAAMETYGLVLQNNGRFEEGGELLDQVLALRRALLGDDHPDTIQTIANAAVRVQLSGQLERAEQLLRTAAEACARKFAPGHPVALLVNNNLATVLMDRDEPGEAVEILTRVLELQRAARGAEHPYTLSAMGNLAIALMLGGRLEEAEDLHVRALDVRRETLGDRHSLTLDSCYNLGVFYSTIGEYELGDELIAEAVETAFEVLGDEHHQVAAYLWGMGKSFLDQGRFAEAEGALLEGEALLERSVEGEVLVERTILATLELLCRRTNQLERASEYAARLADG